MGWKRRTPLCEKTNVNVINKNMAPKKENFVQRCSTRNKENTNKCRKPVNNKLGKSMNLVRQEDNNRELSVRIERSPLIEKKIATKCAATHITKNTANKHKNPIKEKILPRTILRVSLDRNPTVEKKLTRAASQKAKLQLETLQSLMNDSSSLDKSERKQNSCNDVYEFTFDSSEEPDIVNKKKLKQILEDSHDLQNSMKDVLKNIRKKELKKITSRKREKKVPQSKIKNRSPEKNKPRIVKSVTNAENKLLSKNELQNPVIDEIKVSKNPVKKRNLTLPEIIEKSFLEEFNDTFSHISSSQNVSDQALSSLKAYNSNNAPNTTKSVNKSPKINIMSDIVVKSPSNNNTDLGRSINQSRVSYFCDTSNPWRLSVTNSKNPHTFTVKNNSFLPNYDQDIVINSTLSEKISRKHVLNSTSIKEYPKENIYQQTSILNYVNSSNTNLNTTLFTSPRKVLGEINFKQSTPFLPKSGNIQPQILLDISHINIAGTPKKDNVSNLFGFTCDENDENWNPALQNKIETQVPKVKKKKLKKVLFSEEKEVEEENKDVSQDDESQQNEMSSADVELLFQDVEDDNKKLEVKKSRFSYEHVRPKRKRLPSWHDSDSEAEEEDRKIVKKYERTINKRTKAEEQEVDKLAAHYNSMFKEVEEYTLLIE